MVKAIFENVEKGRQVIPNNAIEANRKGRLEVRLVPADRNKDRDPQEAGFMGKACDRVVADQKITACQFLIKLRFGGGAKASDQIASGAADAEAEVLGSPLEMSFTRVKAGLKLVGSPASGLLASDLDPRFKIGEVGLEIKGGELGGKLGTVYGLFFPRFEPYAIGPHPLTAEESIGSHGVVADLSGPGANFLQTFLAYRIAEDRAAIRRGVPVDGKICIGFPKLGVRGDIALRWNDAYLEAKRLKAKGRVKQYSDPVADGKIFRARYQKGIVLVQQRGRYFN